MTEPNTPDDGSLPEIDFSPSSGSRRGGAEPIDRLSSDPRGNPATRYPVQGAGYGDETAQGETHLVDYLRIVYKRRQLTAAAFILIFGSVAVYTFTAKPEYLARVQILIENENPNVVKFDQIYEQDKGADEYYQTQYRILRSRLIARRVLDSQKLWKHPAFANPKTISGTVIGAIAGAVDRVGDMLGAKAASEPPDSRETRSQTAAIDGFLRHLIVSPVRNSRLVDVSYESSDPKLSAQLANAVAEQYIAQSLEFKFNTSKSATAWLEEQMTSQRKEVESSENALQQYREQNDAVSLEERQNIVVQKLADLNAAVTKLKTERIQKEAAYLQIKAAQNDRTALDTIPAILASGFIQQQKSELANLQRQRAELSNKFGPKHPDMVKVELATQSAEVKIQAETEKVIQSLRNDFEQARAQERSLSIALEEQKREAQDLNRKGIEYGVLSRDAASNRQIFDSLMQRTKETGISGELRTTNIRVVDAAELPRAPSSPDVPYNLTLGLFAALIVSLGLAFFLEYMDNRIKNPQEVIQYLDLPFLGMVPAIFEGENPLIGRGVSPGFAEAFRSVRTNLLFASAEEGGRSVLVTSTSPGEGKTVVAANLAVALAQSDQRVLLIDGDLRRPRVHSMMQIAQEPGLSNVLVGRCKVSEAVHKTETPGLWVLAAGVCPPNPAELLGSARFKEFLVALKPHFDWIVIDTPPVMAVTDSSVVSHLASHVLFVVGCEMTSRYAAQRAVEQLSRVRAKMVGVVLNRVDLAHNAYYYSHYYKREYGKYYADGASTAQN